MASNSFYVDSVSYATLKSALTTLASHEPGNTYLQQAVAHLPSSDPSGGAGFQLSLPYARMLGLTSVSESPDDAVSLNTSYNWSYGQDVINTLVHEISEGGLGRIGGLGDQNGFWSIMDLFRYNSSGVADYSDGRDRQTTYFSYNGGATLSSQSYNNEYSGGSQVNGNDTADFTQVDVFGTGSPGETNGLSQTDTELWRPWVGRLCRVPSFRLRRHISLRRLSLCPRCFRSAIRTESPSPITPSLIADPVTSSSTASPNRTIPRST